MGIDEAYFRDRDGDITIEYDIPDTCPLCYTVILPHAIGYIQRGEHHKEGSALEVAFRCTKCQRLFIGTYEYGVSNGYSLRELSPKIAQKMSFSEEINNTSPIFINVYNQSLAAEAADLQQLTGLGLRKALEFLIKDFLISRHPSEKNEIEKTFLAKCIDQYIDDNLLKECAKRAIWIGNDETHYIRKWNDKDVADLKILIRLTVNWIENILLTEK